MPGGAGFCRLEGGQSAFVEGAFPGDRVCVHEIETKRGYVRAARWELEAPAPERIEAVCPIAEACGGCDWMRLELGAQRRNKARIVVEALERTGRITLEAEPEVVARGGPLHYRTRIRLHVDDSGRVGYFGRHSRALVPTATCAVASAPLEQMLAVLSTLEPTLQRLLARFESLELSLADDAGRAAIELLPRSGRSPADPELRPLFDHLGAHAVVRRSGGAFSQVNAAVNAALVERVLGGAERRGARTFLDLYAGAGNFSLPLAKAGGQGVAVELDPRAAAAARRSAADQSLSLEVLAMDVVRGVAQLSKAKRRFDLVVLDPPRAGARLVLPKLASLRPPAVAYVSCDPVTLARDLRTLLDQGMKLDSVTCFDMFPQTHHVEVLAYLDRP